MKRVGEVQLVSRYIRYIRYIRGAARLSPSPFTRATRTSTYLVSAALTAPLVTGGRRGEELIEARAALEAAQFELAEAVRERDSTRHELEARGVDLEARGDEVQQLTQQLQQVILSSQRAVETKRRPSRT